jgi:hypothetical protein
MRRCASVAGLIDELPCVRCAQARDAACFQCARGTNAHDGQHGHAPLLVRAAYCVRERCVALTAVDRLWYGMAHVWSLRGLAEDIYRFTPVVMDLDEVAMFHGD